VRGLAPGGEPWKELLRHKANQTKLPVHGMGPTTQDINWMFSATKLKRPPTSLWKSILHAWLSVRPGLGKSEPTNSAEILRHPIFGNPLITNPNGKPLGYSGKSEGNALANAGRSRICDFWDSKEDKWKNLADLGVSLQTTNRVNKKLIIDSIPWNPATANEKPMVGDWVSKKEPDQIAPPDWIYQITDTNHDTASAKEYKKLSSTGRIKATSSHDVIIPLRGYERVRVLEQERHGATLKLAKSFPPPRERTPDILDIRVRFHIRAPMGPRRLELATKRQY
jgi:hypothetical protein